MDRKFLSQSNFPESEFQVIRIGNYSTSYNTWFYIEVKDINGKEYSMELPYRLNSAYKRASYLSQHINSGDKIKLSCKILDNNALTSISSYSYYPARIEIIRVIADAEERIAAILYTTEDWHSDERDEFYQLYRKGYTKSELFQIFGREDINVEWENARIRAGKESIITGQNFHDFFCGIDSDYKGSCILYGASHKFQFGEKKVLDSEKPIPITEDETLFNGWKTFIGIFKERASKEERVEFQFDFDKKDKFNELKFFSSNYDILCPSSSSDKVRVHLRVEEYSNGIPTAYSFYFYKKKNDDEGQINVFAKYGDAFIRYIMHLKDKVYQDTFSGYEGLANENRKISIKSAVSAIMSRNMSHNIGSHCIQYTGASLLDLANHSIQCGPKIRGASSLLFYIQGRMDFLATLISGERFSLGPVDFKYHIYNRLIQDDLIILSTKDIKNSRFKAITGSVDKLSPIIENFKNRISNSGRDVNGLLDSYGKLITSITNVESLFDDNRKQTYNYILENLVKSENYSRASTGRIDIKLQINGKTVLPSEYSSFCIAVPGGTLSTHAFFIILENLIRNAAKHNPQKKGNDLVETICVTTNNQTADFRIFDNKNNANAVCDVIKKKLCELQILDDALQVEKNSKGLKEILFAILWLRALENEERFQEILFEIDNAKGNQKTELIKKYAFDIIDEDNNFGIKFSLPLYKTYTSFDNLEQFDKTLSKMRADIILCQNDDAYKKVHPLFPRAGMVNINPSSFEKMKSSVDEDCDENNDFCVGTKLLHNIINTEYGVDSEEISIIVGTDGIRSNQAEPKNTLYYKRHLNSNPEELEKASKYLYADSVSGNNFTNDLCQNFLNGIKEGKYINWEYKYQSLKIIESALTRITIIDERFLGTISERELELKNIRVLNLRSDITRATSLNDVFEGSKFKDNLNDTMYLSIHLGIIEKLLEINGNWFDKVHNQYNENNKCNVSRVECLLVLLKKYFGRKNKPLYISIHSGRGNYSYAMEQYFKEYPFITLSSLWDAFYDSKYSLTQLFANNRYTDKIDINKSE